MPRFSDDDVLDFLVLEALHERGNRDIRSAEKDQERKRFRESHKKFDPNDPNASLPPQGG